MMVNLIQSALNRYLALDPESRVQLKKLENKVATIELLGLAVSFQLVFTSEKIKVKQNDFLPANAHIKGTPLTLLRMALADGDRKHFFSNNSVSIDGDLDFAQEVVDLFDQLEIDWEEHASHWIGDVAAHQLSNVLLKTKNNICQIFQSMTQNINEYTHEEIVLFPPTFALRDFFDEVDQLRMDVDRAEMRVKRLLLQLRKQ